MFSWSSSSPSSSSEVQSELCALGTGFFSALMGTWRSVGLNACLLEEGLIARGNREVLVEADWAGMAATAGVIVVTVAVYGNVYFGDGCLDLSCITFHPPASLVVFAVGLTRSKGRAPTDKRAAVTAGARASAK
ncbi:unnamed protein product [Jaminaea pallidilutea]